MSVAFAEPVLVRPTADVRAGRPAPAPTSTAPTRTAPTRTAPTRTAPTRTAPTRTTPTRITPRRPGPGVGPTARPRRLRFTAPAVAGAGSGARGCQAARAVQPVRTPQTWHLTERGLAVVLVLAAALLAASVAVVGLTALRVTGEGYQPSHGSAARVLVQP